MQCRLGAPQEVVFPYVADSSKLYEWIPVVRRSWADDRNAETPGREGSVRVIDSGLGRKTYEIIKLFEAPRCLAYSATDESLFDLVTDHLSVITVEPANDAHSVLTWLAYGKSASSMPLRWLGSRVFQFALGGGIKNLEKRFPV